MKPNMITKLLWFVLSLLISGADAQTLLSVKQGGTGVGTITGLVVGNGTSAFSAYAGQTCTNQFVRALSAAGAATCASIGTSDIAASITLTTPNIGAATGTSLFVGDYTTAINWAGVSDATFQAASTGTTAQAGLLLARYSNDTTATRVVMAKSRGATGGTLTYPQTDDPLGHYSFAGANENAGRFNNAAAMSAYAGSTWTSTNQESYLKFWVNPINVIGTSVVARLDSDGTFTLGATKATGTGSLYAGAISGTAANASGTFLSGGATTRTYIGIGTNAVKAWLGVAGGTSSIITGDAQNDLAIMSLGANINFSVDSGTTKNMALSSTGLTIIVPTSVSGTVAGLTLTGSNTTYYQSVAVGKGANLVARTGNTDSYWTANTDLYTYTSNGVASYWQSNSGVTSWNYVSTGTAGTAISGGTTTQVFSLDSSGALFYLPTGTQALFKGYSVMRGEALNGHGNLALGGEATYKGLVDYDARNNTIFYLANTYNSASAAVTIATKDGSSNWVTHAFTSGGLTTSGTLNSSGLVVTANSASVTLKEASAGSSIWLQYNNSANSRRGYLGFGSGSANPRFDLYIDDASGYFDINRKAQIAVAGIATGHALVLSSGDATGLMFKTTSSNAAARNFTLGSGFAAYGIFDIRAGIAKGDDPYTSGLSFVQIDAGGGAATDYKAITVTNTAHSYLSFGIERSTGTALVAGSAAYDAVIRADNTDTGSSSRLHIAIDDSIVGTFFPAGFKFTGQAVGQSERIEYLDSGGTLVGSFAVGQSYNAASAGDAIWYHNKTGQNMYVQNVSAGVYLAQAGTSWTSNSDERMKDIIAPLTGAADKLSTLRTVVGRYKDDSDTVRRLFLIAQDVQKVYPETVDVSKDSNKMLGLRYTELIPAIISAINEHTNEIKALKAKLQ